jgi:hypothetical protein
MGGGDSADQFFLLIYYPGAATDQRRLGLLGEGGNGPADGVGLVEVVGVEPGQDVTPAALPAFLDGFGLSPIRFGRPMEVGVLLVGFQDF